MEKKTLHMRIYEKYSIEQNTNPHISPPYGGLLLWLSFNNLRRWSGRQERGDVGIKLSHKP